MWQLPACYSPPAGTSDTCKAILKITNCNRCTHMCRKVQIMKQMFSNNVIFNKMAARMTVCRWEDVAPTYIVWLVNGQHTLGVLWLVPYVSTDKAHSVTVKLWQGQQTVTNIGIRTSGHQNASKMNQAGQPVHSQTNFYITHNDFMQ